MGARASSLLGQYIARHRRGLVFRKLLGATRHYQAWHANLNYDLATNGEAFVLDTVSRFRPRMLVDVGANTGEWTVAAKQRCSEAELHALEVSPITFETLAENSGSLARVTCHPHGLSDAAGTIPLRHYTDLPALTTATDYPHPFAFEEISGRVETGDAFVEREGIGHIDLLKIDVEGMEDRVLAGFSATLDRGAIDLIQFEYGRVNILSHFLLRDFYALLRKRGFAIGKIYPNYVDFREYSLDDEDFAGPNYLACRETLVEHIRALCP